MADDKTIHQELDDAASTVEDVVADSTATDNDMDNTIDNVVDAMDEIELDDDDDNTDIDRTHENDSKDLAEEIEDNVELKEAYDLIDDELIVSIQEAYDEHFED